VVIVDPPTLSVLLADMALLLLDLTLDDIAVSIGVDTTGHGAGAPLTFDETDLVVLIPILFTEKKFSIFCVIFWREFVKITLFSDIIFLYFIDCLHV